MLGFGSIGKGVLPLILRHIGIQPEQIRIVTGDARGAKIAASYGVSTRVHKLTRDTYRDVLTPLLGRGDFLLNLSVDVSSVALIALCQEIGALYLDTCIEPWPGGYTDRSLTPSQRSNYALRESALDLARTLPSGPTAVLAQGLGVKAMHIAERDTQVSSINKRPGEFVNTWSIDGFAGEGCQPAELGWGTHERTLPADARRHDFGCDAAVYLLRPGASTRVLSWTPLEGPFHGFLITHNESISIADYYTVSENGAAVYRPTLHYAYHPCEDAVLSVHELAGKNWHQ
ncbi:MAG TPA: saccharopine dehydrogenase NADP-binding domain-containing protein, partial [Burkholderiaceae bacterium]|nr:saccharopine dehydrogenase NADP-binding domain-containing protein [Burkholderiaceae bacterium]